MAYAPQQTYYLTVSTLQGGAFAQCNYYYDPACTQAVRGNTLMIPKGMSGCVLVQVQMSTSQGLTLWAAVSKTIGPTFGLSTFDQAAPSVLNVGGTNQPIQSVMVAMPASPDSGVRGVSLMFLNTNTGQIVPTADPQIRNDE